MKRSWMVPAALAAGFLMPFNPAWATKVLGTVASGTVTATPIAGQIEVDHVTYHVKPHSRADDELRSFKVGDVIDLVLDGAPGKGAAVLSIARHAGS